METNKFKLQGTDEIDEAINNASATITDEYFKQLGIMDVVENHDTTWYEVQEELVNAMLKVAYDILAE